MFYKINKSGCQEHKGLCEIRYDLYLEPTDDGYSEHYVSVPVWPEKGYEGKVDGIGIPLDQEDYDSWVKSLPTVMQHNPFCCHFCQFEPTVTDEEILFVGELAMDMAGKNWATRELNRNRNMATNSLNTSTYRAAIEAMATVDEDKIDDSLKSAVSRIKLCISRMELVHSTDFVEFEKTVSTNYSIRG